MSATPLSIAQLQALTGGELTSMPRIVAIVVSAKGREHTIYNPISNGICVLVDLDTGESESFYYLAEEGESAPKARPSVGEQLELI